MNPTRRLWSGTFVSAYFPLARPRETNDLLHRGTLIDLISSYVSLASSRKTIPYSANMIENSRFVIFFLCLTSGKYWPARPWKSGIVLSDMSFLATALGAYVLLHASAWIFLRTIFPFVCASGRYDTPYLICKVPELQKIFSGLLYNVVSLNPIIMWNKSTVNGRKRVVDGGNTRGLTDLFR